MNIDELIIEQVSDGSTVTRKWLGFTDREILFPLFGAVGSACVTMLYNVGVPLELLLPFIPVPFCLALIILFLLVYKKPPHYAEDLLEEACYGGEYCPYGKKFNHAPDGMFIDDIIIWGDLSSGSWSCGLSLLIPPMDYARNEDKNNLKHQIDELVNGDTATIEAIYPDGEIQLTDGRTVPADFESISYGYATTSHKSQGSTCDHAILAAAQMDNRACYVGSSRGRQSVKVFCPDFEYLHSSVKRNSEHLTGHDLIVSRSKHVEPSRKSQISQHNFKYSLFS